MSVAISSWMKELSCPPVPQRHHHVPLHAAGAGRPRRQLARRDPIGPVGEHLERALAAEAVHRSVHPRAALAGLHAVVPGGDRRVEIIEVLDDPRRRVAELMAELAPLLHDVDPRRLALEALVDPVALRPGAREVARRRRLDQRVPVVPRVVLGGGRLIGRDDAGQLDLVTPGRELDLLGVDQAVPAHPDVVGRLRHLGQQETAVVVGDDDLGELRLELLGLGDDPHPGLGAGVALDDATDVPLGRIGFPRARDGDQRDDQAAQGQAVQGETQQRAPW